MSSHCNLSIDDVARIGLMYLDGDKFEDILLDKFGHTDYDFDNFNVVKKSVMKMERINPALGLTAVLWQLRPDNDGVVVPLVAGNALPIEGWGRMRINEEMKKVFVTGTNQVKDRDGVCFSYYYPIKNTDAEIVGVLELIYGERERNDI